MRYFAPHLVLLYVTDDNVKFSYYTVKFCDVSGCFEVIKRPFVVQNIEHFFSSVAVM